MLEELRVRDLGVIADLQLVPGPSLSVLTGETGAGKTLVVEALELALGGKADTRLVRAGAEEAVVEARFGLDGDDELVVSRVLPKDGRARAYLNGRMAPLADLEAHGRDLVDLYGQHAHQSLLRSSAQRAALDRFADVDLSRVRELRRSIASLDEQIAALGGDERARARELDRLRFEAGEIDAAAIAGAQEDETLLAEEDLLANATAVREAAERAREALAGEHGRDALSLLERARAELGPFEFFAGSSARLESLALELEDVARELRASTERIEDDPQRLAQVQERRALLAKLVRRHGEHLADVLVAHEEIRTRIDELESSSERREALQRARAALAEELACEEQAVGDKRRAGAPALAAAVEAHFAGLALGRARLSVALDESPIADDVAFLLSANTGEPFGPLAKVASGGELARVMLALRLVLSDAPPTLVFDEVDAGIGGEVALAVGRALRELATGHQVLVVTHLAQVAAFAEQHFVVEKAELGGRTVTSLRRVEGDERLVELSRMLSGYPDSKLALDHAAEVLERAQHASAAFAPH